MKIAYEGVARTVRRSINWRSLVIVCLALTGSVWIFIVVSWITGLHGVNGLERWFFPFKLFLSLLRVLGFTLPLIAIAYILLREAKPSSGRLLPRRILLFILICLLVLGIVLPTGLYAGIIYCGNYDAGDKPPLLLLSDVTGRYGVPDLCLSFWTRDETANTLTWGREDPENRVEEAVPSRQHSFMLRDLEPGSEYRYRVNDGEPVTFSTPAAVADILKFAVGSDPHFGGNGNRGGITRRILEQMGDPAHGYDYLFLLGDLVHLGFWDPSWKELMEDINSAAPGLPLRTVMGNHDGIFTGYEKYFKYLYPDRMSNLSGSRLWQRVDVNNIHIFFLDLEWGTEAYTPEQQAWFEGQLADIPREDWTVVMQHTLYYVSDHFDNGDPMYVNVDTRDTLVPLFERYGVDLVLCGHNHHLELLSRNGVTYALTAGLGGAMNDVGNYRAGESVWVDDQDYGYLEVSISGDTAMLTFRDRDYRELYTATIAK